MAQLETRQIARNVYTLNATADELRAIANKIEDMGKNSLPGMDTRLVITRQGDPLTIEVNAVNSNGLFSSKTDQMRHRYEPNKEVTTKEQSDQYITT